ncbi:MAG: S46 family peptidase [Rhodothermales bacterium]|nr:S46 family peptidase [Rhodothermales bacterium]
MTAFARPALVALALVLMTGCATTTSEMAVITERPRPAAPPTVTPAADVTTPAPEETIQPGRFDGGKMWTFDNPPLEYFREAYGLELNDQWFEVASRSALRFGESCSASFVSRRGLVMTNHHCARESITKVSGAGESLLDDGFYATSLDAERKVEDLYVDQLLFIADVTDKLTDDIPDYQNDEEEADARERAIEALEERMTRDARGQDTTHIVQIVPLYNGGKYSAYTFKRYSDVRLVVAPELLMGKFGGDPDNFTYPRYSLDMTFFRVYGPDGAPIETRYFFPWSTAGVQEGDPVFVVGNPGSTSRLNTISQLEYERDFDLPQQLEVLTAFAGIMKTYLDTQPPGDANGDIRNDYYSLSNSIKAMEGQLAGLRDPALMARKRAAEQNLRRAIDADPKLKADYGNVLDDLLAVQASKKATARQAGALTFYGSALGSRILTRALYGYAYTLLKQRGATQTTLDELLKDANELKDYPPEVERSLIVARIRQMERYLGRTDPTIRGMLQGLTPEALADTLVATSALVDSARFVVLLDGTYLSSKDASVPVINALAPLYFTLGQQIGSFGDREGNLNAELSRARFAVDGFTSPPDATFSLRLTDGVVQGYAYNGTVAPYKTTFYGVYDHYVTYGPNSEWDLPEAWKRVPPGLDLSTPLNLVSTNDITGGNSGSPLLNKNLEVVGLIFDGNIESLPNEYVYTDKAARAISVDARGILEALDEMYDADRIVLELTAGQMTATEQEADAVRGE